MKWHSASAWLEERRDIWFDLLRIYLGVGLFIRGLVFFFGGGQVVFRLAGDSGNAWFVTAMGAHFVMLAHLCGGVLLAFGLLTRIAALVQVPILVGAVVLHAADGLFALGQSLEFSAFVLVTLVIIAIAGPGRLSVDHYTFRRSGSSDLHPPSSMREAESHGH